MFPNRGDVGDTEAPQLATHQGLGLDTFNCSTGPARPVLGGSEEGQERFRFGTKSVLSPVSGPGGLSPGSSPEKNKNKKKTPQKNKHPKKPTLVLTPGRNSVHYFRHIPQGSRRNVEEGKKSFGASSHRTKRFHPRARPFPALGRGRGLTPLRSPRPPQRGPATPSRLHLTLRKAGAASCCPRRTRTFSLRDSETRRV